MRKSKAILRRVGLGAATAILAGMAVAVGTTVASAATPTLTFSPETGTNQTAITVTSIGFCPSGASSYFDVAITSGSGLSAPANIAPKAAISTASTGATGYTVALGETMATWAQNNNVTTLSGPYVFAWQCFSGALSSTPNASYTGSLDFTSPTTYTDGATTASLAASATGTQAYGTVETLTATISANSGTAAPTGTVQFFDGATAINATGISVTPGTGTSSTATLTLDGIGSDPPLPTSGTHSYTVTFTGTGAFQGSTSSPAQTLTISGSTPTLMLSGPTGTVYDNQTIPLSATVSPAVAGSVNFYAGTTTTGTPLNSSPIPVTSGSPTANYSVPAQSAGSYSYTAEFTPTDTTDVASATSNTVSITVTHFAGATTNQNIVVTVTNGTLTITSSSTPVDLSTPVLNSTASALVATGNINTVTVTDTRAGNIGYTVTGQLTGQFAGTGTVSPTSAVDAISGDNLGWAPVAPTTQGAGQSASAGPAVAAPTTPLTCTGSGTTWTCATNGINLQSKAATLGTAAAGGSYGQILYNAALTLVIPVNTGADTYQDTLTLTAF